MKAYSEGQLDAVKALDCGVSRSILFRRALVYFSLRRSDYWRGYVDRLTSAVR